MRIDQKKPEEVVARVAEVQELHAAIVATAARPQSAETECLREELTRLRADLAASQAGCERLRADAERYRLIQERFDTTKLSRSERFLEAIGLDPADAEKPLSDIVDAARAGKGE